jgi:hypothetical protein
MKLSILILDGQTKDLIIMLKKYVDKSSIDGITQNDIDTVKNMEGEMGASDILNSITMIIEAAEKPLVELVKCLQRFVDNYRTKISIPSKNGPIEIIHGRSMKPEELKEVIVAILETNNQDHD